MVPLTVGPGGEGVPRHVMDGDLPNKPLVEAIVEIRWSLQSPAEGLQVDPHYKLLVGSIYDRLKDRYPVHEQLPAALVPDELVGHTVQHRFRSAAGSWPLIQLGPGVMTVNETESYTWGTFRQAVLDAIVALFDAYPAPAALAIEMATLRYLDAVRLADASAVSFLESNLGVKVELRSTLFEDGNLQGDANLVDLRTAYRCTKPAGDVLARFRTGQLRGEQAIIWETTVRSQGDATPKQRDDFAQWLTDAHEVTHKWFFTLIEGELERTFRSGA